MRTESEIGGADVIMLGTFDPALFTPTWFVLHGLLPEGAADSAEVEIIHPLVAEFTFDWLDLKVTAEHFSAETSQAPHVRDLVVRVFREYLPHTPLKDSRSTVASTSGCGVRPNEIESAERWPRWSRGAVGVRILDRTASMAE